MADSYARSRPSYPRELFAWLGALAPARESAWDCGCGSGQATRPLVAEFAQVVATDASAVQIDHAPELAGVDWRAEPAESSSLADRSVDALVIAQALHWPTERRHVENGYADLEIPFERMSPPAAAMTASWDAGRELAYLRSWSATRLAREETGLDPVATVESKVRGLWGEGVREVEWPLTVIAGVLDDRG